MDLHEINTQQVARMREKVKSLREKNGWSIRHLSKLTGISERTLSNTVNGRYLVYSACLSCAASTATSCPIYSEIDNTKGGKNVSGHIAPAIWP